MSIGGKIINIRENDELVAANLVNDKDSVLLATAEGLALKTSVSNVSRMGRNAAGNILMRFKTDTDNIVSAINVKKNMKLFVVTKNGIGKRLEPELITGRNRRGGKGMVYYKPDDKTGIVVSVLTVEDTDTVFIGTVSNQVIRIRACDIRETGRIGKGVSLIKLVDGDSIISVSSAPEEKITENESED
jgi:DNA gyrase subunit A